MQNEYIQSEMNSINEHKPPIQQEPTQKLREMSTNRLPKIENLIRKAPTQESIIK